MRCAIVLAASLAMYLATSPAQAASPKVGKPAPDFELTLLDGTKVKLADMKGQVVVLNFWATWCGPCKQEMPLLSSYFRKAQQYGLRVYAVTTEDSVSLNQLSPLAKVLAFPMVRRLKGPYEVMDGVPTNYVIDRAGVLRYAKANALDLAAMNTILIPLLNEPAPEPVVQSDLPAKPSSVSSGVSASPAS